MGGQALGSWWLWDYGEGETTVEIAGPIQVGRVPGEPEVTSTGANAFVIPISVGARVTPLYGAPFPKMPEITHPLVWVTGDAEVIWWDGVAQYTNVQHADFWTGQYVEGAGITIDDLVLSRSAASWMSSPPVVSR